MHLITFESIEEKAAMIESEWLDRWFVDLRDVTVNIAQKWRNVSISIHGVPFMAWNYENFHKIGSVFGRVVSVEYANLDGAKVSLISDCLFKINCKMWLQIGEIFFPIFLFETEEKP